MTEPYEYASAVPRREDSSPPPDVKQILATSSGTLFSPENGNSAVGIRPSGPRWESPASLPGLLRPGLLQQLGNASDPEPAESLCAVSCPLSTSGSMQHTADSIQGGLHTIFCLLPTSAGIPVSCILSTVYFGRHPDSCPSLARRSSLLGGFVSRFRPRTVRQGSLRPTNDERTNDERCLPAHHPESRHRRPWPITRRCSD
jgi:hypothetical protein